VECVSECQCETEYVCVCVFVHEVEGVSAFVVF